MLVAGFGSAVLLKNGMLTFHEYLVAKYCVETYKAPQTKIAISRAHINVEMITDAMISNPPMVGVSRLDKCACGPSSRICWPMFHFFRASTSVRPNRSEISIAVIDAYAVRKVTY